MTKKTTEIKTTDNRVRPLPVLKPTANRSDQGSASGGTNMLPEITAEADKLAKSLNDAENGGEAGQQFSKFVHDLSISSETMNKPTKDVFANIGKPGDPEATKVKKFLLTFALAAAKVPELKSQVEVIKGLTKSSTEKPFKDYVAAIRAIIVKAKGGEGWSTIKKVLVFGGGALALGGLVYLATRKTDTPRKTKKRNN